MPQHCDLVITKNVQREMIGEVPPQSGLFSSHLAPHSATTLAVLPETVRSGSGLYPKPPAHGPAPDRTNSSFLREGGIDDPKVKLTDAGESLHRSFAFWRSSAKPWGKDVEIAGLKRTWGEAPRQSPVRPAPLTSVAPRIAPGRPLASTDWRRAAQPSFLSISLAGNSKRAVWPCHMPAVCTSETAFQ